MVLSLMAGSAAFAEQLSGRVEWRTRGAAKPAQAVVYAEPARS